MRDKLTGATPGSASGSPRRGLLSDFKRRKIIDVKGSSVFVSCTCPETTRATSMLWRAEHDVTSREAAMQFAGETDAMTVGVLYDVTLRTLVDQLAGSEHLARGNGKPPSRNEFLAQFFM